jgi:enoyl-CoA hydratase/carnithine racemase
MTELEAPGLYERGGRVAVATPNRPQLLNAANGALAGAAGHALEQAAGDDQVRTLVITGAGRAFCVGADLSENARGRSIAAPGFAQWGFAGIVRHRVAKPIVAAVNGDALGGGTEIVLACDLAVADEDAPALDQAIALAERVAECAPIAVQESKRVAMSTLSAGSDWEQKVRRTNNSAIERVFATDDAREGARACPERRAPTWRGM